MAIFSRIIPGTGIRKTSTNTAGHAFRNTEGPDSQLRLQEFLETNPGTKENAIQPLLDVDREMIIRWMLRDYRPVFGGSTIK